MERTNGGDEVEEKSLEIEDNEELQTPASVETDTTFEPTIEMIMDELNDDEATLREEEEIAALENDNPLDEIATLKEESEMPLEELLAKYKALPPAPGPPRKKIKKALKKQTKALKPKDTNSFKNETTHEEEQHPIDEIIETSAQEETELEQTNGDDEELQEIEEVTSSVENLNKQEDNSDVAIKTPEKLKIRRSHLFELYPEENFDNTAIAAAKDQGAQILSEDEDMEDIEEEEETDPDYVKKTIMVGSAFQAVIPGISQYGDILPYENEDKLIWEPSQVSEAEVEEYLLKIREIKANVTDEEPTNTSLADDKSECLKVDEVPKAIAEPIPDKQNNDVLIKPPNSAADSDTSGVVKDNEQALHLLVQCGYDFKEALRRKGLNAVPLTGGTMSIWSEEECQKFEEGIQKFGKDFFKIRQHQVRTRTMRELVLFYYLWKKSERRDHSFANADTVDHMDIYLNENSNSNIVAASSTLPTGRKINGCTQNNFSIMLGNQTSGSGNNHPTSPTKIRKRTASDGGANTMHNSGTNLSK